MAQPALAAGPTCQASEYVGQQFGGREITSGFGSRTPPVDPNTGRTGSSTHLALDLRTRDNPLVGAFNGGTVVHAGPRGGYGNTVIVRNGNFEVQYAHAGTLNVNVGDTVTPGQNLGDWSTCTGICSGPHLDLIYRVNTGGDNWINVDPIIAQNLIDQGLTPGSPEFNERVIAETENRCSVNRNDLRRTNPNRAGGPSEEDMMCDPNIRARVSEQVEGSVAKVNDVIKTHYAPPPSTSQVANTPCMSKELQRITNQFGSFPRQAAGSLTGGLMSAAGPISGLMQRLFQSEFQSLNQAASILPSMLNFQSQASSVLSGLLGSLGLGDAFSSEVCGLMVDMLLKYIQCENPIQMPNINNMFGSLNNLLPNNCAGNALRTGLMEAGNMRSIQTVNQPVSIGSGGQFVPGSADSANQARGTTWTPPASTSSGN